MFSLRPLVYLVFALSLVVLTGCDGKKGRAPGPIRAVVTIAPLAGLVKPLLPASAEVKILMAPGRSEHGEEFTADDLATLAKADVVVLVGMMLEPKVEAFLKDHPDPARQVVNFADTVGIEGLAACDHDHAAGDHHHHHDAEDPHLWLDPNLVAKVVPAIRTAVAAATKSTPDWNESKIAAAEADLLAEIKRVDDEYKAALAPHAGKGIVTHHAAWGRLADRYGLEVAEVLRPVESVEPDAAHTAAIIAAVKASGTGVIFVEPAYDRRSAERVAQAAGARLVTIDPLGTGDWDAMMRANLAGFLDAFTSSSPTTPTTPAAPTPAADPAKTR